MLQPSEQQLKRQADRYYDLIIEEIKFISNKIYIQPAIPITKPTIIPKTTPTNQ